MELKSPKPLGRPNPRIVAEIYRAFALLGAESDLLGVVGSWGDCLPEEEVLTGLKSWNEATEKEVCGRLELYRSSLSREKGLQELVDLLIENWHPWKPYKYDYNKLPEETEKVSDLYAKENKKD